MSIKVILDEKGVYAAQGTSDTDTGFQKTFGGYVEKPEFVGGSVTMSLTSSALAVTASVNTVLSLPTSPASGQSYDIYKATTVAMTVSLTCSTGAHTINGAGTSATLLTTAGKSSVTFIGSPANMWITK